MAKRRRTRRTNRRRARNYKEAKTLVLTRKVAPLHRKRALKGIRNRRRMAKNPRRGKGRRKNPITLSQPLKALTQGYNLQTLTEAGVITAGVVGNAWLSGMLKGLGFMPSFLKEGIGANVLGLGTAGLLGAGVGAVAPQYAPKIFFGGVLGEVVGVVKDLMSKAGLLKGLGDYLTPANAAGAIPLGYFGDYLTPANAAGAVPLGAYSGDVTVGEELAGY